MLIVILITKKYKPPFIPKLKYDWDLKYFDPSFTTQDIDNSFSDDDNDKNSDNKNVNSTNNILSNTNLNIINLN